MSTNPAFNRAEHPEPSKPIGELIERLVSRRAMLRGLTAAASGLVIGGATHLPGATPETEIETPHGGLTFSEIPHQAPCPPGTACPGSELRVPEGYKAEVVIRWGDPVLPGAPVFDLQNQTAEAQKSQFGYNNDFVAFVPRDRSGDDPNRGLLCVNHEYSSPELMFEGLPTDRKKLMEAITDEQIRIEMAAHGMSVVEIQRGASGEWKPVPDSPRNRRINALDTPIQISGPAAGSPRMRTTQDPEGRTVIGMINNCAGGVTPWGTILSGEENFPYYFVGESPDPMEITNHARYGVGKSPEYAWSRVEPRYDVAQEPREANRFGWIVEIDPYHPERPPKKRTALGRMRHEGAAAVLNHDNRVVFYMGDDERFEFVYKFVTRRPWNEEHREANADLLDEGTLYVARFSDDGTLRWLPLVHGQGPLDKAHGFADQADVLIEARRAASLLGATPMDRPEDIESNPRNHRVYVLLTNNDKRPEGVTDAANPRPTNKHGHILELITPMTGGKADHATLEQRWGIFLLGGDPSDPASGARYNPNVSNHGWLSCPDNCAFDNQGRIWIATDGAEKAAGHTDGVYVAETDGPKRALTRHFLSGPSGAEICGPFISPDGTTLFVSVQHPGEGSTRDNPTTRWPNPPDSGLPPMPAVIAIQRADGGGLGT